MDDRKLSRTPSAGHVQNPMQSSSESRRQPVEGAHDEKENGTDPTEWNAGRSALLLHRAVYNAAPPAPAGRYVFAIALIGLRSEHSGTNADIVACKPSHGRSDRFFFEKKMI
ncbi:hypothetical protein GWI33_011111 [Rhynchophorus ferrugineus]|uniref:Uncharacterized protein n=1 Tax=Rhynchophorus ferrugineus TaxID=354439 RepID=A0A834IUF5_RHYFE|nr:hypothetical protein GWI33_011111 [Rhynchophorus ferrugineus]